MNPVKILIVGAGSRGSTYAGFAAAFPEKARVVGVAEPRAFYRQRLAQAHDLPEENVFSQWQELAARGKIADAVVIATPDRVHVEPALAFAALGYDILLEKPMAPGEEDCLRIFQAVRSAGSIFAVCHVLRYTRYTQMLKALLDSGAIGEIVDVQHLEPVGYWHQAHSFVRGNWRNERLSSPMLLSKSCHDLDWLSYVIGSRCMSVSSFGNLKHFCKDQKPAGAGEATRCLDCAYDPNCPYSARKIYLGRLEQGQTGWPVDILTSDLTVEGVTQALRDGPYGRCVYECDNDVVDHQVVSLLFSGGQTASFTLTAFNQADHRQTRIFGTRGEIYGDGAKIHAFDFLTDQTQVIDTEAPDSSILGGHGGGDGGLMEAFIAAVAERDQGKVLSGPWETLESHLMVFAAEKARRENRVVNLTEEYWPLIKSQDEKVL
jgi:predicted dehydrogenase